MRIAALFLWILLAHENLNAQQVVGFVKDDGGKPLSGASVALKDLGDSSIVKLGISNASGQYEFVAVPAGRYFISVSHVGFDPQNSASFSITPEPVHQVADIRLSRAANHLQEAVVTARKPLVEARPDKLILNVEGSINEIGSDALELLRKAPGVTVDKDNNLSLNGKNGVQVYIDGRPSYLSAANLADYLKTLPSSSIASIEIISNPSARYDAAGNAGIINIRLRKNQAYGTNMTAGAGYNIGTYSKYNGTFSFNHRTRDINVYGDYSFNHAQNEGYSTLFRTQLDTSFLQSTTLVNTITSHTYKFGADYFADDRNTLGFIVNGATSTTDIKSNSATPIVYVPANTTDRILRANNRTSAGRGNLNIDLNYRFADSSGHELDIDGDYGHYHFRSDQYQPNNYYDSTGKSLLYTSNYRMLSPANIDIYTLKADYAANWAGGHLNFGAKTSFVRTANDFQEWDVDNSAGAAHMVMDTLRSNNFDYRENINSVYAEFKHTLKTWSVMGGLRVENTNGKGVSIGYRAASGIAPPDPYLPYDSVFLRHYTDFFPSASVTYNGVARQQWTLTYSRRIDRPTYQSLNPFEFRLDDYTYSRGNTRLRPQYTNSLGLSFSWNSRLTATLNYSHTDQLATTLIDTIEGSKSISEQENLASQDVVSLNLSYPFQYKWYRAFINLSGYYQLNRADFGAGRTIHLDVFNAVIYTQHSFRLGHGWTGEIIQYYTSPNVWLATLRARELWNIDAGLQKSLFNGNGTIKASVTDIFNTLHWMATSNFAGQDLRASGGSETRQFKLYFTYRFGNKQVKAARRHSTGAEEETRRVSTQ